MLKKRIAALTMGAALATSAFLAPQATAGTHDHKCDKGYEYVAGTHQVGDKLTVDTPKGYKYESHTPATSLLKVDEKRGETVFKIVRGEKGKNTVKVTFAKKYKKGGKWVTDYKHVNAEFKLGKCEKKGSDKKQPQKSSVDHKSLSLSSKK
ncbi:hypothetical protein NYP18_10040 [Corynebacterium sp. YIM 101645]|uniref:Secreted protein n=1 Tax=Corynebacterium lemuris TaxID=1859292 RepID=A0ABT2FXN2_9CORY|nr:hypothetical protein [Corynebacterium lemuris]MCS5479993.1 hypothetical protein [Corynebacterium lemuris]